MRRAVVLLLPLLLLASPSRPQRPPRWTVCESVDARNSAESLVRALQNCSVVDGFVHIQLMDLGNESSEQLSFPALREISHHLLLYRVTGLRSLAQLFPNLAVIRGATLYFEHYALVVYEMFGLQDVALPALAVVPRGGVLLERNPALCYVNTVDWSRILRDPNLGENGLRLREGEAVPCPQSCPAHCGGEGSHCWSEHHCQTDCPKRCGDAACYKAHSNVVPDAGPAELLSTSPHELDCCHPECLGGCLGPGAHQCYLCKNVMYDQACHARCPPHLLYHGNLCITRARCVAVPEPPHQSWRVFNGSCVPFCPPDHEEVADTCQPCGPGGCKKVCVSNKVDSLSKAALLKGCTHINTSLEIQINGGKNVSPLLEEYLGTIEEIDGTLKITRSFSLVSLNFLRSLRVIHGKQLEHGRYSLVLVENQNLQTLWNWTGRAVGLRLAAGTIFVHQNPELCPREVARLQEAIKLPPGSVTEQDVSNVTNGDAVECVLVDLKARVTTKLASGVILEWEVLSTPRQGTQLGYLVYSIEAPEQNVTAYDGLDACGGNDWRVDDVAVVEETGGGVNQILTQLKPNTQYAFYVKTYSLTSPSHLGGQSAIQYFTTLPSRPSPPRDLRAASHHPAEMLLQWSPPLRSNGNLSHFLVVGQWIPDDQAFLLEQRDYCQHPMTPESGKPLPQTPHRPTPVSQPPGAQQLAGPARQLQAEDCLAKCGLALQTKEREASKEDCFTSFLHELPYQQEQHNYTHSLAQDMFPQDEALDERRKNESRDPAASLNVTDASGTLHKFSITVPPDRISVLARPLRHFGLYTIQVWACRQAHPEEAPNAERCSSASHVALRTAPLHTRDMVNSLNATVLGPSGVRLHWHAPASPNGLVLAYEVEYRREGQGSSFRPLTECVSVSQFRASGETFVLGSLPAGVYSVRVRTTSLAGDGPYTDKLTFALPSHTEYGKSTLLQNITIVTLLCAVSLLGGLLVFYWRRKHHSPEAEDMCLIASVNPDYVSANYTEDEWELQRDRVTLLRELGQGSFGMVYEGELTGEGSAPPTPCAVKTMNESASCRERLQFLHEASLMKAFSAQHVVRLLGVVSRGQPTLVVMELMARGDLKTYLRASRDSDDPSPQRILHMAAQIADGMLYLTNKKFVHRDLAARNCMVSQDLTVKIGDFGMTRDIYETDYYRKGSKGLLPVRWMAPESLQDGVFSSASDVWSYGVVLWEMATHAAQPYQGQSNEQVLQQILAGVYLTAPEECAEPLAALMEACWQRSPLARPSFTQLLERLLNYTPPEFSLVSFYHSREDSTEPSPRLAAPSPVRNGTAQMLLP